MHAARGHKCFGRHSITAKPEVFFNESSGLIEQYGGWFLHYVIFLNGASWEISQERTTASAIRHQNIPAPLGKQEPESKVYVNLPTEHFEDALFSLPDLQDAKLHTWTHSMISNYRAAI